MVIICSCEILSPTLESKFLRKDVVTSSFMFFCFCINMDFEYGVTWLCPLPKTFFYSFDFLYKY